MDRFLGLPYPGVLIDPLPNLAAELPFAHMVIFFVVFSSLFFDERLYFATLNNISTGRKNSLVLAQERNLLPWVCLSLVVMYISLHFIV